MPIFWSLLPKRPWNTLLSKSTPSLFSPTSFNSSVRSSFPQTSCIGVVSANSLQLKRTWFSNQWKPFQQDMPTIVEQEERAKPIPLEKLIPHMYSFNDLQEANFMESYEVIEMGRHVKITTAGRIYSFSVLIMAGNQRGIAGLGFGKGESFGKAMVKAKQDLHKHLVPLFIFENRTVPQARTFKFRAIKVAVAPRPTGFGLSGSDLACRFAELYGFKDLWIRTWGGSRRNKHNILLATFKALSESCFNPEDVARAQGRKFLNLNRLFFPEVTVGWAEAGEPLSKWRGK